jgi:hypothetical protein
MSSSRTAQLPALPTHPTQRPLRTLPLPTRHHLQLVTSSSRTALPPALSTHPTCHPHSPPPLLYWHHLLSCPHQLLRTTWPQRTILLLTTVVWMLRQLIAFRQTVPTTSPRIHQKTRWTTSPVTRLLMCHH